MALPQSQSSSGQSRRSLPPPNFDLARDIEAAKKKSSRFCSFAVRVEVVTAGAQDELMQSLDYKLKTSNTSYVTARHDVQYFPSSLSSFSPATSRVCRIPLTSGTSFIDPESIKIAFRVRNTDGANPLVPATPNPAASAATTSTTTAAPWPCTTC